MQSMEFPLVIFTVLSQAAIGLTLMRAVRTTSGDADSATRTEWLLIAGLMVAGLLGSLFHLGHPLSAPMALTHLGTAWLSREVLFAGMFMGVAALAVVAGNVAGKPALAWLGTALGLGVILSAGMTYAPPALPALNNALPAAFFLTSAVLLGSGFGSWFADEGLRPLMVRIFTGAVVVGLVLYLVAPCVWLSGGEVMRMTGQAWLASGFYWAHLGVLAVALAVAWKTSDIPVWLPVLVLIGELVGRAGFFADTVHTAANMGGLY
ncbi:DmsC/YnfH family molybdoenzyme membrane anchor subunit [Pseudodesulfovibrio indicus]|uniref:dimethyl sulfoxide reductase anchor subunit family protein n=1 Tax=Pseudodesulfovibrio indicus TaxID=1716143 RepID=UPI00292EC74F|nr:DmsC/YnfH family molybdoenzyme membrane anchor subunit [Pseudodesulfovibrio indicus]